MNYSRVVTIIVTLSVLGAGFYARTDKSVFNRWIGPDPERSLASNGRAYRKSDLEEFWKTQRCEDILSLEKRLSSSSNTTTWWPVCTPLMEFFYSTQNPSASVPEIEQAVTQQIHGWDLCAPKAPIKMRNSSNYVAPSRAQQKATLLNAGERQETYTLVEKLKARASAFCCDPSEPGLCGKMFDATRLTWCDPESDPNKPDACTGNPNYFESLTWFTPGKLVLSPVKGANGKGLSHNPKSLLHELGHACSASRQTAKRLYQSFGCRIDVDDQRMYQRLFKHFGATDETFLCVEELASGAESTRFKPFIPCEKGCPLSYLEESFADFFAIQALTQDELRQSVPGYCQNFRDNQHALRADLLNCFLRTPSVRKKFEKSLQCLL